MTTLGGKERGAAFESFWLLFILFYFIYFRACVCVLWRRSPAQPRKSGYNFVALRLYRYDRDQMLTRGSRKGRESERERGERKEPPAAASANSYINIRARNGIPASITHTRVFRARFSGTRRLGVTQRETSPFWKEQERRGRRSHTWQGGGICPVMIRWDFIQMADCGRYK